MLTKYFKENKFFITAIALLHLVFFLLAAHFKKIYMGDSSEYIYEALNIKNLFFFYSGNPILPIEPELMTQRQPLYPMFLLLVYFITVNNWIVLVLQNILSIINILYCRKIFQKLGFQKKQDWLLVALVAAYPAQFINANTIASDILLQTFSLLYFGYFVALIQTRKIIYSFAMGIALVAGMLVKPVLYPFVVVHIFILLGVALYQKIKLQRTLAIAMLPICAVLFYNYWNYTRTEKFHFSSNQAFNAIYYYYPYMSSQFGADSANRFLVNERAAIASIPAYKDRYNYANERGVDLLKQNLLPYLLFHFKHSLRIFVEPGKGEIDLFTGQLSYGKLYSKQQTGFYSSIKKEGWGGLFTFISSNPSIYCVFLVFIANCFKIFGVVLFFINKSIAASIKIFLFLFIFYFAFAAGPIANTRYFLPVSLLISGCAAMGFGSKLINKTKISWYAIE